MKRVSGQSSVAVGPHLPNQVPLAGHLTRCHFLWHLQVDHLAVGFWNVKGGKTHHALVGRGSPASAVTVCHTPGCCPPGSWVLECKEAKTAML